MPIAKARLRPRMSPSFAPRSMKAAITSVYIVIAVWTPEIVVSRSSTIWVIATFMTLESSTITNWAEASIISGIHLRICTDPRARVPAESPEPLPKRSSEQALLLAPELLGIEAAGIPQSDESLELVDAGRPGKGLA